MKTNITVENNIPTYEKNLTNGEAMKKELIIVRGAPGSGKSTYALDSMDFNRDRGISSDVFEADQFMVDSQGLYKFDSLRLEECHMKCQQEVCKAMIANTEVIYVSNTFIKRCEGEVYYALAKMWGYEVIVIRSYNRYRNEHGVPQAIVEEMRANMEPYDNEREKFDQAYDPY